MFGEALAVVLRSVGSGWSVEQHLVRVQMLSKSLAGEEVARKIISVLSVTYSIHSNNIFAAMRDRAPMNNGAMTTLKIVYFSVVVECFSHTTCISITLEAVSTLQLWLNLSICGSISFPIVLRQGCFGNRARDVLCPATV